MLEKKIPKSVSKVFNWLIAVLLSASIALSWYFIGSYLLDYFSSNKHPEPWGIPIVFVITLICFLFLLKKFSIPFERINLPIINKRVTLYFLAFSVFVILLFLTRYKIVNSHERGFYKVDRWTGSTYFIYGTSEQKVNRSKE